VINRHFAFSFKKLRSNFLGLRGVPLRIFDLNFVQVVSAPFGDHCMEQQHRIYIAYNRKFDVRDLGQEKG
jgi:uncharacterized membrane protein YccF (DUF307 family)